MASPKTALRIYIGEFLATFFFIFAAEGAAYASTPASSPIVSGIAVALAGFAVVSVFGTISGAHFNPAVTIGAVAGMRMSPITGLIYIILQLLAGIAVTLILGIVYPNPYSEVVNSLIISVPRGTSWWAAVLMESILTFVLVLVIYGVALGLPSEEERQNGAAGGIVTENDEPPSEEKVVRKNTYAPLAIGSTLGFLAYIGGPASGGAYNPARVMGPAFLAGKYTDIGVYWTGAVIGPIVAAGIWRGVFF